MKIIDINDKKIWEKFITEYSPQSLFQSWSWGEAVGKTQNSNLKSQSLWRIGIDDNNNLIGIAQIVKVMAKRGTFLHLRHGPIFSFWKKEYIDFLLDYLKVLSRNEKSSFIRISPLIEISPENQKLFKKLGFYNAPIHSMDGEVCWVLDLDQEQENLLCTMRKTTRYLIRQAQKSGVKIVKSSDKKDLKEFFSLYNKTAVRHHFVPYKGIIEEFSEFISDDQILLFKGYYQNILLAAALIIFYNHQAIYHHSASVESKIPVNYLLTWEAILEAKRRGKKIYNFWGIASEVKQRHPWKGLTQFKKGFGGRKVEYLHAQDLPLSFRYCATYSIELLRKILKGY